MTEPHDSLSAAQPFLKWAGGKGQLLEQYTAHFPTPHGAYHEPFVGSGAVFFALRKRGGYSRYHLSDVNPDLVNCYVAVRDHVDALIDLLAEHARAHAADADTHFYAVRALDRDPAWESTDPVVRAARMIYLNKTCYNGLWRVNSQGQFNVPIGRYTNPAILDETRLRTDSVALQGTDIAVRPFQSVLERAQPGDCVYFDPPYHPLNPTSNFTSYAKDNFGEDDQRQLADVFAELDRMGCQIMLSNSDTEFIRALYAGFRISTVTARRAINSQPGSRGAITEILITNFTR